MADRAKSEFHLLGLPVRHLVLLRGGIGLVIGEAALVELREPLLLPNGLL